jgi:hypothetical protein|tara:strand:+ start:682 stop:879 length:198 start_codon:yes stop_codon:yes gene_type:complete
MKTIKEFKDHFSAEEIKLLKEIVCGKLEFSVLEQQIKDFYEDSYIEPNENLIDKLEFDMEYVRLI